MRRLAHLVPAPASARSRAYAARRAALAGWIATSLAVACGPVGGAGPSLHLLRFQQDRSRDVGLNETLIFHFSRSLQRASVTAGSVRIEEREGRPARGGLRVDRATLTFTPELALDADLSDGGLRPGTEYEVVLAGFPRPDGLQSEDGLPLAATLRLGFRTATLGGDAPLFVESFAERGPLLHVPRREIGPLEPIELVCEYEGIDPTSLAAGEFAVKPHEEERGGTLELVPRLIENKSDGARIALFPARLGGVLPVLEPGTWYLARLESRLRTLGGRALETGWPRLQTIVVRAQEVEGERVTFDRPSRRWFDEPPGFDGTAYWPDDGRGVGIRYPAAAGDGRHGALAPLREWSGAPAKEGDAQATYLRVPEGSVVDLGARPGAIVLRSQGAIEIDGILRRGVAGPRGDALEAELEVLLARPRQSWPTLSEWLERARASSDPWTILIAGGEIRIRGRVEVSGPLLLVAGGWVRVAGYVEARSVWKSREGRRNVLRMRDVPLRIDEPERNQLREGLSLGVLTHPIRPSGGVDAWLEAVPTIRARGGSARVRFVGLRDALRPTEPTLEYEAVDDLNLLEGCQALRLLLAVEMPPGQGEPWEPPWIDAVDLSWTERSAH